MSDAETLSVYARKAEEYAGLTDAHNRRDPCLAAFIAAVPPGERVLDLGCGPGACAAAMAEAGLAVEAVDPVPEMVALAARHPGVKARQGTFDDLRGNAVHDGVWANFSLLHAPRAAMPDHLDRIAAALRPGGVFHIAVKTGSGSGRDRLGRLYTYFDAAELYGLLEAAGFAVVARSEGCDTGLSGETAPWIALLARRA